MSTNTTFDAEELTTIHTALIKARSVLFDSVEIRFDRRSTLRISDDIPTWKGKRGTCPTLKDIDDAIVLMRLHINSVEAIQMYDAMGAFDQPKKEDPEGPS